MYVCGCCVSTVATKVPRMQEESDWQRYLEQAGLEAAEAAEAAKKFVSHKVQLAHVVM